MSPDCLCTDGHNHLCPKHGIVRERSPKRDRRPLKGGRGPQRKTPLREKSEPKELDDARWAGVKDCMIYMLEKLTTDGACCEECGVHGNRTTLDLDHVYPRGKGGKSVASNGALLCNKNHPAGNDCHQRIKHRNYPEWSQSA